MYLADGLKQLSRMCKKFRCAGCPLSGIGFCSIAQEDRSTDINERASAIIEKWAEENPEPQYPTWGEWLEKMGIMENIHDKLNNYKQVMEVCGMPLYSIPTEKVFHHIPADIAQKLGLQPR